MKSIIITAVGSFSAPAVIKAAKEAGFFVIAAEINPAEVVAESVNADLYRVVPRCTEKEAYIAALVSIIKETGAEAVLPLTDPELDVLSEAREQLLPAVLYASPKEAVRRARDKRESRKAVLSAKEKLSGLEKIEVIPGGMLTEAKKEDLKLPLILKPFNGRSSEGLYRVYTGIEFLKTLSIIHERGQEADYLIQPLIAGNVITVDTVRWPDGLTLSLPREELRRTHNGAGLSVHVFRDDVLEAAAGAAAEELGVLGCVNFEFIKADDGKYYFLECNPRFAGGLGFSEAAGFDAAGYHFSVFSGSAKAAGRENGAAEAERGGAAAVEIRENHAEDLYIARKYIEVITKTC